MESFPASFAPHPGHPHVVVFARRSCADFLDFVTEELMDQQLLDEINSGFGNLRKRLEELQKVHCQVFRAKRRARAKRGRGSCGTSR